MFSKVTKLELIVWAIIFGVSAATILRTFM